MFPSIIIRPSARTSTGGYSDLRRSILRRRGILKLIYHALAVLAVLASCTSNPASATELKSFSQDGYSFKYPPAWGDVKFTTVKAQALDNPTDIPDGVAPAHV